MDQKKTSELHSLIVRNIIFGVEDSLVSTVGFFAGISIGDISATKLFFIGVVYLFVEGFSMGAGSYLSEHSTQEFETGEKVKGHAPLVGAIVMFLSFVIAGLVPILPYLFFPLSQGVIVSVVASLIFLGILGYAQARLSKVRTIRSIVRMVLIGGIAIVLGIAIGKIFGVS